jgi:glutamine amidotransferase
MNTHISYCIVTVKYEGGIGDFSKIRRKARDGLKDSVYEMIQGTTDSELTFALFMNQIDDIMAVHSPNELRLKVVRTIKIIRDLCLEAGTTTPSLLNFAVILMNQFFTFESKTE